MVTVRMLARAAGPQFNYDIGSVVEVPDKFAKALIAGGYAERVVSEADIETAELTKPIVETATLKKVAPKK